MDNLITVVHILDLHKDPEANLYFRCPYVSLHSFNFFICFFKHRFGFTMIMQCHRIGTILECANYAQVRDQYFIWCLVMCWLTLTTMIDIFIWILRGCSLFIMVQHLDMLLIILTSVVMLVTWISWIYVFRRAITRMLMTMFVSG